MKIIQQQQEKKKQPPRQHNKQQYLFVIPIELANIVFVKGINLDILCLQGGNQNCAVPTFMQK